jgi:hypothetical protein
MHIETPLGDLIAGISDGEAQQAYVCLETEYNTYDMCLADVPGEDLRESAYSDLAEGDIQILTWGDIYSEFYTEKTVIKADDIRDIEKEYRDAGNAAARYEDIDENAIDDICAMFEGLGYGHKCAVELVDVNGKGNVFIEAERNYDPEAFAKDISKEEYENGYGDLYHVTASLVDGNGRCVVIEDVSDVHITELYEEIMGLACIEPELVESYEQNEIVTPTEEALAMETEEYDER